jgi:peptide deformylase
MPVRPILQLGDARLREIAWPVEDPSAHEVTALVDDLAETLAYWRATTGYGRGIAAPQLGVRLRVVFLQLPGEKPWPLINPEIVKHSEEKIVVWDACLSFLSIFHAGRTSSRDYCALSGHERGKTPILCWGRP